jgi:hypothetical protein
MSQDQTLSLSMAGGQARGKDSLLAQPLLQWLGQAASFPGFAEESARMELEIVSEMNLIKPKQAICLQEVAFSFP